MENLLILSIIFNLTSLNYKFYSESIII